MRYDLQIISSWIAEKSNVIEIGCGNGDFLYYLKQRKNNRVTGIDPLQSRVDSCISRGLEVCKGDVCSDLLNYHGDSFDYVILSQSLQQIHDSIDFMEGLLRIGRHVIVRIPNCGHWSIRDKLLNHNNGSKPNIQSPCRTPDIRRMSINDFSEFTRKLNADIMKKATIKLFSNNLTKGRIVKIFPNLFATWGIFMISKKKKSDLQLNPASNLK